MKDIILKSVQDYLNQFSSSNPGDPAYRQGESLFSNGQCSVLSESEKRFEFAVEEKQNDYFVGIETSGAINASCSCKSEMACRHQFAAFLQLEELLKGTDALPKHGIKYSRQGMIKRVIEERKSKALEADYAVVFSENIFGEHVLTNERNKQYKLTFRDFTRKHGYCTCPDYRTNKLGTCKHLIFAYENLSQLGLEIPENLPPYPFIEIFLNPFRNYKISWFYPEKPQGKTAELIYRYFGNKNFIEEEDILNFLGFIERAENFGQILIRPEVFEKLGKKYEEAAIERLRKNTEPDFSHLKIKLLPYQQTGANFAVFKTGAIIADEMGLGKTVQAIATAEMKMTLFGFKKNLIICPDWNKKHWQHEIVRVCGKSSLIVNGKGIPEIADYETFEYFIADYETVVGSPEAIQKLTPDFIIVDEAQRIKDYESVTAAAIKSIQRKHILVLTGNPIENQLIELYSIVLLVDQELLAPLWEFSYQHFYFDETEKNKITGQFDLEKLWKKLEHIMIRREKHEVIRQLPKVSYIENPVRMHPAQARLHLKYAQEAVLLLKKSIVTAFDRQRLWMLLKMMKLVSNSTYLIDKSTNHASKLGELQHILVEKLNIRPGNRKILIYTEWDTMNRLIAQLLRTNQQSFVEITSETDPGLYQNIVAGFENDNRCNVLISSVPIEFQLFSGKIDTIINYDVPISRSLQNSRIGNIAELTENEGSLTIINLIAEDSIEELFTPEADLAYLSNLKSDFENDNRQDFGLEEDDRQQLIEKTENLINNLGVRIHDIKSRKKTDASQISLDFSGDSENQRLFEEREEITTADKSENKLAGKKPRVPALKVDEEKVKDLMAEGAGFFGSLLRASTGISLATKDYMIDFDKKTGELTLKIHLNKNRNN